MAFRLEGFIDFAIKVNGIDIPLGDGAIKAVTVIQNMHMLSPSIQGTIIDTSGLQSKYGLFRDGAKIDIAFGPGGRPYPASTFRQMNTPDGNSRGQAPHISFNGVLDLPKFFRGVADEAVSKATSSDVFKQIGGKLGLKVDADSTNDRMTWLPLNRPFAQTLRHVADHGFANATSAMHMALGSAGDGQWTLLYKDLTRQAKKTPVVNIVEEKWAKPSDVAVISSSFRSHSGTLNHQGGYGGNIHQVNKDGDMSMFDKIPVIKSMASSLGMSSAVKSAIGSLPRMFMPMDTSNTHKRYGQAKLQNERQKMTFSNFVSVVTRDYTNVRILDPVNLVLAAGDEPDSVLNGVYLVHSRSQHAAGRNYREKLVLVRQGANTGSVGEAQV